MCPAVSVCAGVQTVRSFQELNYWGKTSDKMDAYNVGGPIYIDPNTTPLWSPTIPVTDNACMLIVGPFRGRSRILLPHTKRTRASEG